MTKILWPVDGVFWLTYQTALGSAVYDELLYLLLLLWTKLWTPQISHVEVLTPNVTILGDKAFKVMIKVKWGQKGGTLIQYG